MTKNGRNVSSNFTNLFASMERDSKKPQGIFEYGHEHFQECDIERLARIRETYIHGDTDMGLTNSGNKILHSTMMYDIKWMVEKLEAIKGGDRPV